MILTIGLSSLLEVTALEHRAARVNSSYSSYNILADPFSNAVAYDESIDYNSTALFSGGIDPANLPEALVNGKCTAIYPHSRLRVNTVFEVVHSKGKETAYTDKHPAYDIVRGPSGQGLSEGYFPEIAAVANRVDATIAYDQLHVDAYLDWLDGTSPKNAEGSLKGVPTLFGGNFQSGDSRSDPLSRDVSADSK
jgi:hypothetical protein